MEDGKQNNNKEEKIVSVPKNAAELQKIRLDRLMSNPEKKAHIPDASKPYKPREPLEFIRNVWGSSAGAGSGDFHVYRGVRRREYARQKFNKEKNEKEDADEAYHKKVEENAKAAEERTAKKRAKRQKKKQKQKNKKPKKEEEKAEESEEDEDSEAEEADKNRIKCELVDNNKNISNDSTDNSNVANSDSEDSTKNIMNNESDNIVNNEKDSEDRLQKGR